MPSNKKHHYVPKFYLRLFSEDGRSVNLYNIRGSRSIFGANLANQCYRNYFYGLEPELEVNLAQIEGVASPIIKQIIRTSTLPPLDSPDHVVLIYFLLLQYGRTVYAAEALDESFDGMWKQVLKHSKDISSEDLEKIRIGHGDPGKASLGFTVGHFPLLLDLDWKLIIATKHQEFITCDNPVVLYNQFFSYRRVGSNVGIACKGLQIFFPISPHHLVLLFDHDVYSVGSMSKSAVSNVTDRDVDQLNILQGASASENLYFHSSALDVERIAFLSSNFRRKHKATTKVVSRRREGDQETELIQTSREDVTTGLQLTFVRVTRTARTWRDEFRRRPSQPVVVVRDPDRVREHERAWDALLTAARRNDGSKET